MGRGKAADGFDSVMGRRRGSAPRHLEERIDHALQGRPTFVLANLSDTAKRRVWMHEVHALFAALRRLIEGGAPVEALGYDTSGLHSVLSAFDFAQENEERLGELREGHMGGASGDEAASAIVRASEMAPKGARIIVVTDSALPTGRDSLPEALDMAASRGQSVHFLCHGSDWDQGQFERAYSAEASTFAPDGDLLLGLHESLEATPAHGFAKEPLGEDGRTGI
jgi:hypothetical protein